MDRGEPIHGERIVDGDASTLTVLTLYKSGTVTVRVLAVDEWLVITDYQIQLESGGDYSLLANSAAGGRYIAHGNAAANGGIAMSLVSPYVCPKGVVPKFAGANANRSTCIVEGYIVKA